MIGCLPTQALAFLAVFVYATHATQAIAFEWKPGLRLTWQYVDETIFELVARQVRADKMRRIDRLRRHRQPLNIHTYIHIIHLLHHSFTTNLAIKYKMLVLLIL